jgi:alkylhydroperoxidase family enzyme
LSERLSAGPIGSQNALMGIVFVSRLLLAYARKLTLSPARMTQADADAVFAAGWSERALHDAALTVCLFNFMNRLLDGHGCKGAAEIYAVRGKVLMDEGYATLLKLLQ